jgi:putative spermidine/putrescine transport system ATP-binding protein
MLDGRNLVTQMGKLATGMRVFRRPSPPVVEPRATDARANAPVFAGVERKINSTASAACGGTVRLVGVTKRYGRVEAVQRLTLEVAAGEFVTLLGPSGSGKTSTLMMVAGHELPNAGEITIDDRDVTRVPAHRRDIGMVFQHLALFPHLSVAANVAFPLRMRHRPTRETAERVAAALALVRLDGVAERYPRQLSGGQQQRVALARALVFGPSILLMDEPLSALDKQLREEMQIEIRRLQQRLRITTLYVTHDQREALTLSDRIALLNGGWLAQVGTPQALYDRPRNRFVAGFIGESNFLAGQVCDVAHGECRLILHGGLVLTAPAAAGIQPGARVTAAVRPEAVQVGGHVGADFNRAEGVVEQVVYYGEARRLVVRLSDTDSFVVKQGNAGLDGSVSSGDRVTIAWKCSKTIVLGED